MINEKTNYVEGCRIEDVWRDVMWLCVKNGWDFVVKGGSYKGQIRKQLPFVTLRITKPWERPLSPIMPESLNFTPTTDENIEEYFNRYLVEDKIAENEQYTYGTFIKPQLPIIIKRLVETSGNTNQACITVGDTPSTFLDDPPCLRVIDFKVIKRRLVMTVFFRSWDLVTGLPENLGGLQMVKEYVLAHFPEDMGIVDGELIAFSDGLHIYEQYFEISDMLNVDKIKIGDDVLGEKEEFGKTLDEGKK